MYSSAQMKAARALLEWRQDHLAKAAGVSVETVKRMEKNGPLKSSGENLVKVLKAFQDAGISFESNGGEGVRRKK